MAADTAPRRERKPRGNRERIERAAIVATAATLQLSTGATQEQAAAALGVDSSTVSRAVNGPFGLAVMHSTIDASRQFLAHQAASAAQRAVDHLDSDRDDVSLKAAFGILDRVGIGPSQHVHVTAERLTDEQLEAEAARAIEYLAQRKPR